MGNAGFSKALGRRDVVSSERTCISSLLDSCLEGTRINLSSLNTKVEGYPIRPWSELGASMRLSTFSVAAISVIRGSSAS